MATLKHEAHALNIVYDDGVLLMRCVRLVFKYNCFRMRASSSYFQIFG